MRGRRLVLVALAAALASAAGAREHGPKRMQVDMVVIHSTGGPWCDGGKPVWIKAGTLDDNLRHIAAHPTLGIHHMIDRDGTHRTSVPEDEIAHHVFRHSARSIAVELVNDGDGLDPFPPAQVEATVKLLLGIVQRWGVKRENVVRHADLDRSPMPCAPERRRKVDPGAAYPHEAVLDAVFGPRR